MAAVVVMACNRADYLERTIKSVLKYVLYFSIIFFTHILSMIIVLNNYLFSSSVMIYLFFQISKAHLFKISFIHISGILDVLSSGSHFSSCCSLL